MPRATAKKIQENQPAKQAVSAAEREERRNALFEMAKNACANLGGMAWIDKDRRYMVVDTKYYTVSPK